MMNFTSDTSDFSQQKRDKISLIYTACFYAILLIVFAIIPVKVQKPFKEVTVKLEAPVKPSTPVQTEKKVEPVTKPQAPAKQVTKTEPVQTKPAQAKSTQTPTKPVQTPVKPKTTPRKQQTYAKSMEELMAENASKAKSKNTTWDDSVFDDANTQTTQNTTNQTTQNRNAQTSQSSLSGTAAQTSQVESSSSVVSNNRSSDNNQTAFSDTTEALQKIASTKYVAKGNSQGISYETSQVQISRQLLYPKEPSIVISPNAEKKIGRTKNVYISFTVSASGQVVERTIKIEPLGLLVPEVEAEIKEQIATWRFETGKSDGQAGFNYSIKVE